MTLCPQLAGDPLVKDLKEGLKDFLGERVRLILFGSRARGDFDSGSDIDIAIIVRDLDRDLKIEFWNALPI